MLLGLLLSVLAPRAGAMGLREGRANEHALAGSRGQQHSSSALLPFPMPGLDGTGDPHAEARDREGGTQLWPGRASAQTDEVVGLRPLDAERRAECTIPVLRCSDARGAAERVRRRIGFGSQVVTTQDCKKRYMLDEHLKPVRCRNPRTKIRRGRTEGSWACSARKPATARGRTQVCPGGSAANALQKRACHEAYPRLLQQQRQAFRPMRVRNALLVELKTARGFKQVMPAIDGGGNLMTFRQVIQKYEEAWGDHPQQDQRLYEWDYKKRKFILGNAFRTSQRASSSALMAYSMDDVGTGGTYRLLNGLLSRTDVDVLKLLEAYNRDPAGGSYLPARCRYWLHVFRIFYHTIAEMQLRAADIARHKDDPRLDTGEAHDVLVQGGLYRGVIRHSLRRGTVRAARNPPRKLFRGMCVKEGASHPGDRFSLNFYNHRGKKFFYTGFTSTSQSIDTPLSGPFLGGCSAKGQPTLILIIDATGAAPCFLNSATMSNTPTEEEHLFPPYTRFEITSERVQDCSDGAFADYNDFVQGGGEVNYDNVKCVHVKYVGAARDVATTAVAMPARRGGRLPRRVVTYATALPLDHE